MPVMPLVWRVLSCAEEVSIMTTVAEMTDLELEIALERCFAQHKDAEPTRKAVLHSCAMDVLAEQKRRRDAVLGLKV